MATLLVVHHTPSPSLHTMLTAVLDGTSAEGIVDVEVVSLPALAATSHDALRADGYILGTPANLGYMSGALKHFFDLVYYPCLDVTARRPFGAYVHGDDDLSGAVSGIDKITTGLDWQQVTEHVQVTGRPERVDIDALWNLGATVAARVMESVQH